MDYNGTDGRTHGCTIYLFIILVLEDEIGIFEIEFQQCADVMYGYGHSVVCSGEAYVSFWRGQDPLEVM